jgi:hypothetical protein
LLRVGTIGALGQPDLTHATFAQALDEAKRPEPRARLERGETDRTRGEQGLEPGIVVLSGASEVFDLLCDLGITGTEFIEPGTALVRWQYE